MSTRMRPVSSRQPMDRLAMSMMLSATSMAWLCAMTSHGAEPAKPWRIVVNDNGDFPAPDDIGPGRGSPGRFESQVTGMELIVQYDGEDGWSGR